MKITQVKLFSEPGTVMTCWLPSDEYKLKVAMRISLKGDDRVWVVSEIYGTQDNHEINRR